MPAFWMFESIFTQISTLWKPSHPWPCMISDTLDSSGMCEDESGQVESDWLKKAERKYLIAAGVISATVIVSGIVTFFGTNERCDITIEASKISTLKVDTPFPAHK